MTELQSKTKILINEVAETLSWRSYRTKEVEIAQRKINNGLDEHKIYQNTLGDYEWLKNHQKTCPYNIKEHQSMNQMDSVLNAHVVIAVTLE